MTTDPLRTSVRTNPTSAPRTRTDWERVQAQYATGGPSLREIASAHGITEGAIRKRAKKYDWTRNLACKVKSRADNLMREELVRNAVRSKSSLFSEAEAVEIEAQVQVRIRRLHRTNAGRARDVFMSLLSELEAICGPENTFLLIKLGELMRLPNEDNRDKLNDTYQRLMALPSRAKTMKDLAETMRVLVGIEREAFGLSNTAMERNDPLTTLLHTLASGNGNGFKPVLMDPDHA